MPVAPRSNKLGKKIVYAILGKPANMEERKTRDQRYYDMVTMYQSSYRMR